MELPALERFGVEGFLHVWGVPGVRNQEPVTIAQAAERLGKPAPTVRVWASRHHARKLPKRGKTAWYDWHDLKTIARQLALRQPVPVTPEERDLIRERIKSRAAPVV